MRFFKYKWSTFCLSKDLHPTFYYWTWLVSKHWKRVGMHIAWSYFANACTIKYHNTLLIVCQNACILVIPVRQLLRIIKASSTQFQNSLFPKCTKFINTQEPNFRSSEYTAQFNHFRKKCNKEQNGYYLMGSRFIQVILSQLRLRFSNLNEHLFSKGCIDSPQCRCSGGSETVKHYFIECPMQSGSREDLFGILHNYTDDKSTPAILNIILQSVNIRDHNFKIMEAVSKYIIESNRFT